MTDWFLGAIPIFAIAYIIYRTLESGKCRYCGGSGFDPEAPYERPCQVCVSSETASATVSGLSSSRQGDSSPEERRAQPESAPLSPRE